MFKVITLDARYRGNNFFKYRIEPKLATLYAELKWFKESRLWCWDTFGESVERDICIYLQDRPSWCFHYDPSQKYAWIYLKSDHELALYTLRWKS